jgi:hypothetical protein
MNVSLSKGIPRELKLMMLLIKAIVSVPPFFGLSTDDVAAEVVVLEVVTEDVVVCVVVLVEEPQDIRTSEAMMTNAESRYTHLFFIFPSCILLDIFYPIYT